MPELPDVEILRRYVDATALHKRIRCVTLTTGSLLVNCSPARLTRRLNGASLEGTRRQGKHLGVRLDSGAWLMLHFGMTGYLDYARADGDLPKHSHLVLRFDNGFRLAYVNQRKLGKIRLAEDFDAFVADEGLGPDALAIDRHSFTTLLSNGRGTLKSRLMNQRLIAGLGNVYTDEVFFQSRMYPGTAVKDVDEEATGGLWRNMRRVLRIAIDRQAQPQRFPDSWLIPHRDEERCPRCHHGLKRARIGGRTSRYCPDCQKPPSS